MKLILSKEKDWPFFFALLNEREPYQSISHKDIPSYKDHLDFNKGEPYEQDYVIWNEDEKHGYEKVGRLYLTDRHEIGISIVKRAQGKGLGKKALQIFLRGKKGAFLANINPRNKRSKDLFKKLGFKLIQETYKWER